MRAMKYLHFTHPRGSTSPYRDQYSSCSANKCTRTSETASHESWKRGTHHGNGACLDGSAAVLLQTLPNRLFSPRGSIELSAWNTIPEKKPPIGGSFVVEGMGPFVRGNHADKVGVAPQIPGRQFQNRVQIRYENRGDFWNCVQDGTKSNSAKT